LASHTEARILQYECTVRYGEDYRNVVWLLYGKWNRTWIAYKGV